MKEYHIFYSPDIESTMQLPEEEAAHAIRVLRMHEGEDILVTDGKGKLHYCTITMTTKKLCYVQINSTEEWKPSWKSGIHIAVAPTKNMDRMEWFAEKATEIGMDSLTFIHSANSERTIVKDERIEKILVSAMKQSHKAQKPSLQSMTRFKDLVTIPFEGQKFIAHCYEGQKPHLIDVCLGDTPTLVLIGPEGDFSCEEVRLAESNGFQSISLGESRLRTETAALSAVHIMSLCKRL